MAGDAVGSASSVSALGASALRQYGAGRLFRTRLGVAAISAAACIVGLLPAVLYLEQGTVLYVALAAVLVTAVVAAFQIQPTHLHRPGVLEFIAAGLSAISQGAFIGYVVKECRILARDRAASARVSDRA